MYEPSGQQPQQHNHSHDIVQDYLDSLLREVSLSVLRSESASEPAVTITESAIVTVAETTISSALAVVSEPSAFEISVNPQAEVAIQKAPRPTINEREIPDWGRKGFAALLFDVSGIKMSAPLHTLGGICLIDNNLQTVAAQADWFMGLLRWNDRNLRVVDTARFVMPERVKDNSHRAAYQSVIVLGDSHWALAVDQAEESTHLEADQVRWKHLLGTRPWLAGTLLNRLCALVDVDCLLTLLEEADQGSAVSSRHL